MGSAYQINDQNDLYFATFQVVGWADIFTRQCYRDVIIESFDYCQKNKGLLLHAFVIMSNHVHCIISTQDESLSDIVRDFKKHTAKEVFRLMAEPGRESRWEWLDMVFRYHARFNKRANNRQFWTHESHFVALTSNEMIQSRLDYIHMNPLKAGIVAEPEHYLYSSAAQYAGQDALIDVTLLT